MVGFKGIRDTVASAADNLAATASDTKASVVAVAVLALVGVALGLVAIGVAMKARTA